MATVYWISSGDNDWGTGSNWSGGSIPTNSDTAVLTGAKSNVSIDGSSETVVPGNLYIAEDYAGNVGTSGQGLVMNHATQDVTQTQIYGTGTYYLGNTGGSEYTNVTIRTTNNSPTAVNLEATIPTRLNIISGGCTIESNTVLSGATISIGAQANVTMQATVTLASSPVVNINGGTLAAASSNSTITWNMEGGVLTVTNGDGGTFNLHRGANATYTVDAGTIAAINVFGGLFDLSTEATTKTITNATVWSGGQLDTRSGAADGALTFSNTPVTFGSGEILQAGSSFQVQAY